MCRYFVSCEGLCVVVVIVKQIILFSSYLIKLLLCVPDIPFDSGHQKRMWMRSYLWVPKPPF